MFIDRLIQTIGRLFGMYTQRTAAADCRNTAISDRMANAITAWYRLLYGEDVHDGYPVSKTRAAIFITNFAATLATEELEISTGTGARADFVKQQVARYVLPELHNNVQTAAAGGEVVLKPFIHNGRILCDAVTADRFYPTRINAAKEVEACYFTDYATYNGHDVVRVEFHDMRADGYYIHNEAYYDERGVMKGSFNYHLVPEWADLEEDTKIEGLDRPLFAALKMPMANTVDNTSRLPVSMYANSMDAFEELDRIYTEFLYEIHTGKRKRIVTPDALSATLPGSPNFRPVPYKDLTTDLYLVLDTGEGGQPFDDYTPEIRVEAYQKAIDVQLRLIERQCGFTEGTFTLDVRTGRMTATQVTSDDRDTYSTIKSIQDRGLKQGLEDVIYIYNVYATLGDLAPEGDVEPSVAFGDSVFEDTGTEFGRRKQLVDGGYLKPEKLISWYFGCSDEEALAYMPDGSASLGIDFPTEE